jgi:hypothetical protein
MVLPQWSPVRSGRTDRESTSASTMAWSVNQSADYRGSCFPDGSHAAIRTRTTCSPGRMLKARLSRAMRIPPVATGRRAAADRRRSVTMTGPGWTRNRPPSRGIIRIRRAGAASRNCVLRAVAACSTVSLPKNASIPGASLSPHARPLLCKPAKNALPHPPQSNSQ